MLLTRNFAPLFRRLRWSSTQPDRPPRIPLCDQVRADPMNEAIASLDSLRALEQHYSANSDKYTVWNVLTALSRLVLLDVGVTAKGRDGVNTLGTLLEKHIRPYAESLHPREHAAIFYDFARYSRAAQPRFVQLCKQRLDESIPLWYGKSEGIVWSGGHHVFPSLFSSTLGLCGGELDPGQDIANAAWGFARCRVITPTVLLSFTKEVLVPHVASSLTTDSLVRLLWALASPAQLPSITGKPTALAVEIQATLQKAGKYITTQELEGRPGLLALFNDDSFRTGFQHLITTLKPRVLRAGCNAKPSDLATAAWALAAVGTREDELFHAAFPPPDDDVAWSAVPSEYYMLMHESVELARMKFGPDFKAPVLPERVTNFVKSVASSEHARKPAPKLYANIAKLLKLQNLPFHVRYPAAPGCIVDIAFPDIKVCIDVWDVQTDELKDKWKSLAGLGWEVVDVDHNKFVKLGLEGQKEQISDITFGFHARISEEKRRKSLAAKN